MEETEGKEPLFTTEATITFEEYVRCSNRVCRLSNMLSYILWFGITGALCVMALRSGSWEKALVIAAVSIMKAASSPAVRKEKQKKAFAEKESTGNCYVVYDFYDDGFVMTCNMIPCDYARYYDMWSIVETETNFYILYEPRDGCIIIKENCSPELIRFLHNLKEDSEGPLYKEGARAAVPSEEG